MILRVNGENTQGKTIKGKPKIAVNWPSSDQHGEHFPSRGRTQKIRYMRPYPNELGVWTEEGAAK